MPWHLELSNKPACWKWSGAARLCARDRLHGAKCACTTPLRQGEERRISEFKKNGNGSGHPLTLPCPGANFGGKRRHVFEAHLAPRRRGVGQGGGHGRELWNAACLVGGKARAFPAPPAALHD